MAEFNFDELSDGLRTIFLAGVGAVATSAEKGQQIIDDLVQKGEIAVDQGKVMNSELSHRAKDAAKGALAGARGAAEGATQGAKDAANEVLDAALKARLSVMSDEDRRDYVARVARLADEVTAQKAAAKQTPDPAERSDDQTAEAGESQADDD